MIDQPGIYPNVPFDEYLALPYLNNSAIKMATRSMAHVKATLDGKMGIETKATQFGSLVHTMVLEPDNFDKLYIVDPGPSKFLTSTGKESANYRNTKSFKEWAEEHAVAAGKTLIDEEDLARAKACRDKVAAHPIAQTLLGGDGQREVTIIWDEDDLLCKARCDYLGDWITDLKTTADASAFEKSMGRYDYDVQAAFYRRGVGAVMNGERKNVGFVAVESVEPHEVRAAPMMSQDLDDKDAVISRHLDSVRRCQLSGVWPGYESPEFWQAHRYGNGAEG